MKDEILDEATERQIHVCREMEQRRSRQHCKYCMGHTYSKTVLLLI